MDAMDEQMLREVILDHYKSPRNWGELDDANASAEGTNPLCGDEQRRQGGRGRWRRCG